jgi:excisionase family DNA binding protein
MKVYHRPDVDYLSIDFRDEVEDRSFFQDGMIVRMDKNGNVIGLDITDSSKVFAGSQDEQMTLAEACSFLGISESTMRRKVREKAIKFTKPNGKDFRFRRKDILKLKRAS